MLFKIFVIENIHKIMTEIWKCDNVLYGVVQYENVWVETVLPKFVRKVREIWTK